MLLIVEWREKHQIQPTFDAVGFGGSRAEGGLIASMFAITIDNELVEMDIQLLLQKT